MPAGSIRESVRQIQRRCAALRPRWPFTIQFIRAITIQMIHLRFNSTCNILLEDRDFAGTPDSAA